MKTSSSMYARPMWEYGCWLRTDQATVSHDLAFHSKILQNSNKFRINSNKLGKIRINWNRQWPHCWRKGAEQPDLQQCKLPVKEGSTVTWRTIYKLTVALLLEEGSRATWLTTVQITSEGREHSNLMHNIAPCVTDHCWKGAKRPDKQHYLQLHRLLLEGSKVTW